MAFDYNSAVFSKASARERSPTKQYLWRHFLLLNVRGRSLCWTQHRLLGLLTLFNPVGSLLCSRVLNALYTAQFTWPWFASTCILVWTWQSIVKDVQIPSLYFLLSSYSLMINSAIIKPKKSEFLGRSGSRNPHNN